MNDVRLLGIIGSLRVASVNAATARAATGVARDGVSITLFDVGDVPLYNGDDESDPAAAVTALRDAVGDADGVVLFSPEYNGSLPAVTKNVIDWLSRTPEAWEGTGITMVTMSPGGRAGAGAREHFEAIMSRQASRVFPTIGFGEYSKRLDADGDVSDAETLDELAQFLAEFVDFCAESPESD